MKKNPTSLGLALSFTLAAGSAAFAAYPEKPVVIVVPWPAGGTTDTVARVLADRLSKETGGSFVVENRPGASSAVGAATVARAPADGHTLMFTTGSTVVINPLLTKDLPYKPDDFIGVTSVSTGAFAFLGNNKLTAKTVPEFIEYAKKNPGQVTYATNGPGTFTALIGALIESELKVDLKPIPYQGAAPTVTATISGEVNTNIEAVTTAYPNVEAKQYYAIAIAAEKRHPKLPDVPTFAELGYPNVLGNSWQGLYAPKGTPANVLDTISAAVAKVSTNPDYIQKLEALGQDVLPRSVTDTNQYIGEETARWTAVVKAMDVPK